MPTRATRTISAGIASQTGSYSPAFGIIGVLGGIGVIALIAARRTSVHGHTTVALPQRNTGQ